MRGFAGLKTDREESQQELNIVIFAFDCIKDRMAPDLVCWIRQNIAIAILTPVVDSLKAGAFGVDQREREKYHYCLF